MAEIRLTMGGLVDVASGDEVRTAVDSGVERILGRLPDKDRGIRRRIPASDSANATGTFVLDFGAPGTGWLWWVQEVVVTGADDRTALANSVAALYCGSPPTHRTPTTIDAAPNLGTLIRPGQALPALFPFSGEAFPIHERENLFAVVYLGTAALFVSGVATVVEIPASAVLMDRMP
jgi:hypothetical protein